MHFEFVPEDVLRLTRGIVLKNDKKCGGCELQIPANTDCIQELWHSQGGPYLIHKHYECTEVKEGD